MEERETRKCHICGGLMTPKKPLHSATIERGTWDNIRKDKGQLEWLLKAFSHPDWLCRSCRERARKTPLRSMERLIEEELGMNKEEWDALMEKKQKERKKEHEFIQITKEDVEKSLTSLFSEKE